MASVFELARQYEYASLDYARALGANNRNEGVTSVECGRLRRKRTMAYNAWQAALFAHSMLKHNNGSMA